MRIDEDDWIKVFKRDNGCCQYCDEDLLGSFSAFQSATVDQIISISVGGSDELNNLVLSCPVCNQMLSRACELISFYARKEFIERCRKEKTGYWYNSLFEEMRMEQKKRSASIPEICGDSLISKSSIRPD